MQNHIISTRKHRCLEHLILISLVLSLGACGQLGKRPATGGFSSTDDSGPTGPVDLSGVEEPIPTPLVISKYGNPTSYEVFGKTYRVMDTAQGYSEKGIASWYGRKFHGRRTSSGEPYDMYKFTAAHKTLPIPVFARVTNLENGESIIVRINDRGPFHGDRIIDLSYAAAHRLGIAGKGTGLVEVTALAGGTPTTVTEGTPDKSGDGVPVQVRAYQGTTVVAARPVALAPPPVAISTEPEPSKPGPAPVKPPSLYLQAGAFSQEANARRLLDRLSGTGLAPLRITPPGSLRPDKYYRVVLGPLDSVEQSDHLVQRLQEVGIDNARVIVD